MQVNLSTTDRSTLIRSILQSDARYLEMLLDRKYKLLMELKGLEDSIHKKSLEVKNMQMQLDFVELWS